MDRRRTFARPHHHQSPHTLERGASPDVTAGGKYVCLAAQTALIVPFTWEDETATAVNRKDKLLKRTVIDKHTGRKVPLWELNQLLPLETAELSSHFRQIVGWADEIRRAMPAEEFRSRNFLDQDMLMECSSSATATTHVVEENSGDSVLPVEDCMEDSSAEEDEGESRRRTKMEVWKCSRLRLTANALASVFPEPALWAAADMQGNPHVIAFDNSSHLSFHTSTTSLISRQPDHCAGSDGYRSSENTSGIVTSTGSEGTEETHQNESSGGKEQDSKLMMRMTPRRPLLAIPDSPYFSSISITLPPQTNATVLGTRPAGLLQFQLLDRRRCQSR